MMFIVTLVGLLIERFFDWSHLRNWNWFTAFLRNLSRRFNGKSPFIIIALAILPPIIVVGLVQIAIGGLLYGFIKLLFDLFIFLYCLGPKNLWADSFASINALIHGDRQTAINKLKTSFGLLEINDAESLHRHLLSNIFIEANRRVFAVVFWYAILGPVGAVLYRTVSLAASPAVSLDVTPDVSQNAHRLEMLLDWPSIRLFTLLFALGGHFVQVLSCWRNKAYFKLSNNENVLIKCGVAALGIDTNVLAEDGSVERSAISLLDRVFIILLVIIAIVGVLI